MRLTDKVIVGSEHVDKPVAKYFPHCIVQLEVTEVHLIQVHTVFTALQATNPTQVLFGGRLRLKLLVGVAEGTGRVVGGGNGLHEIELGAVHGLRHGIFIAGHPGV